MVEVRSYAAPTVDEREILRYAGVRAEVEELKPLLLECLQEAKPLLSYRVCFTRCAVRVGANYVDFDFGRIESFSLARRLEGCERAVIFAATLGLGLDRLIARYGTVSPGKAFLLSAIGDERVEALCDLFCRELAAEHALLRPRFSAGYGDLPLSVQREIFSVLDCPRQIGLSLNESLLMSPSKSVTAIVGIEKEGCKSLNS